MNMAIAKGLDGAIINPLVKSMIPPSKQPRPWPVGTTSA
jgi:hypothetical protein